MQWKRKPQEREGTYHFSGCLYVTRRVVEMLRPVEILFIHADILDFVKTHNGADYLQVYQNERGQKLFFIDQLNREMVESGRYPPEENYCTLMFSSDY